MPYRSVAIIPKKVDFETSILELLEKLKTLEWETYYRYDEGIKIKNGFITKRKGLKFKIIVNFPSGIYYKKRWFNRWKKLIKLELPDEIIVKKTSELWKFLSEKEEMKERMETKNKKERQKQEELQNILKLNEMI